MGTIKRIVKIIKREKEMMDKCVRCNSENVVFGATAYHCLDCNYSWIILQDYE